MGTTTARPSWPDRIGALSGAAYVLLIIIGNLLSTGTGEQPRPSGAQVLDEAARQANSTAAQVGLVLEVLGFVAFAFFLAWLGSLLRRAGSTWLVGVALVGGVTTLAVKIGSGPVAVTLLADHERLDERTALALNDVNAAAFVVSFVTFGIFLLGVGLALLETRALGRVAAWSAVVLGAAGIMLTLVSQADPVDTNALPFLLGLLWVLVVSIRLGVRGSRVAAAAPAGTAYGAERSIAAEPAGV